MAIIPDLASQPFKPSLNAEVQPGATHFRLQQDPFVINTFIVPDNLMEQVVGLWLQTHPQEAIRITRSLNGMQKSEMDVIRAIQKSKNG